VNYSLRGTIAALSLFSLMSLLRPYAPQLAALLLPERDRVEILTVEDLAKAQADEDRRTGVAKRVISGRLSLAEAADYFRSFDKAAPRVTLGRSRDPHPGLGDDEWRYVRVIEHVRRLLRVRPGESHPVVDRLEEDRAARFGSEGGR
jgi:hypothetical protein